MDLCVWQKTIGGEDAGSLVSHPTAEDVFVEFHVDAFAAKLYSFDA